MKRDEPEVVALLRTFVAFFDGECSRDHHGYCQTHLLEEACSVARARRFVEALDASVVFVDEGWWHPHVRDGQVHEHPEQGHEQRGWSWTMHRQCEPIYTRRATR